VKLEETQEAFGFALFINPINPIERNFPSISREIAEICL